MPFLHDWVLPAPSCLAMATLSSPDPAPSPLARSTLLEAPRLPGELPPPFAREDTSGREEGAPPRAGDVAGGRLGEEDGNPADFLGPGAVAAAAAALAASAFSCASIALSLASSAASSAAASSSVLPAYTGRGPNAGPPALEKSRMFIGRTGCWITTHQQVITAQKTDCCGTDKDASQARRRAYTNSHTDGATTNMTTKKMLCVSMRCTIT